MPILTQLSPFASYSYRNSHRNLYTFSPSDTVIRIMLFFIHVSMHIYVMTTINVDQASNGAG